MLKWLTLITGLIILTLGIVVLVEGSQEIAGIVITAVSVLVILLGIGLLLKKKTKTRKTTPAATELDEEPPVF
jgi:uncharacterized membrane protein